MKSFFKLNSKGMSITESLVLVGIVSVAFMASLTIQSRNLQVQAQDNVAAAATQTMNRIREVIMNNEAWAQTLANNNSMLCLRQGTTCAANVQNPLPFNIYNPEGQIIVTSLASAAGGGTEGFRLNGAACSAFDMAGNDDCPIAYFVSWQPWFGNSSACPAPCVNPLVQIRVQMFYRPGPNTSVKLNPSNYSFLGDPGTPPALFRSPLSSTRIFRLEHSVPVGSSAPGGACSGTVARAMDVPNAGTANTGDPTGVVTKINATDFSLVPGAYNCTASAQGFAVEGFTVQLRNVTDGTVVGSGSGLAPRWVQSSATFSASFEVPFGSPKIFQMVQTCSTTPGVPAADNFALGLPNSPYATRTVYASLVCSVIPIAN